LKLGLRLYSMAECIGALALSENPSDFFCLKAI